MSIQSVRYQGHEIALVLIKPVEDKCIKIWKNDEIEIVYFRTNGIGKVEQILGSDAIREYETKSRRITDEKYAALISRFEKKFLTHDIHPFFNEWRKMIVQIEGMESLLHSDEHEALQTFINIVEKSIGHIDQFCNGKTHDSEMPLPNIQEIWSKIVEQNSLSKKLRDVHSIKYPDLSIIEELKELDRQRSPRLRLKLPIIFYDWLDFAHVLADLFPLEPEETSVMLAQNNLPGYFENMEFVGRDKQLDELLHFLSHRENRNYFLTITGEGGMGKSTLALAAAYAVLHRDVKGIDISPDELTYQNIIWASAKGRDFQDQNEFSLTPDLEGYDSLIDTILNVLAPGVSLADSKAKQNKVRQILQSTRSLLIIDNMETIDDNQLFHYLKNMIPAPTKIIGTDRNRAKTDRVIQLPPMNHEETKSLIKSLAKNQTKCFSEEDYVKFYKLSYGIPKVIEWGCKLLSTHDVGIEDVFRYLEQAQKGTKNQIYEYLFGFSYDKLSDPSKQILNTMAFFDFPVQCNLIGEIVNIEKGVDEYLDELSSYTLLLIHGSGKERSLYEKYVSIQDYIRNYARVKSGSHSDISLVYQRASKIYLKELLRVCGTKGWPHISAYAWCKKNLQMIKWLFTELMKSGNINDIYGFIISIVPVLSNIGYPDEIDCFCRKALSLILNITDSNVTNFHDFINLSLSTFQKKEGDIKRIAADILQHWTWNLFRQARNDFSEVQAVLNCLLESSDCRNMGKIYILVLRTAALIDKEQNHLDSAEERLLQVVELSRKINDLYIEAITYGSLGSLYRDKNKMDLAVPYMEKAFQTLEQIDDQDSVKEILSVFYQKYAKLMIKLNRIDDALEYIQKAMLIDQVIGRQYGFAHNKRLMAIIHEQGKKYSEAYRLIKEAREIFVRLNSGKEIEVDYERIKALYENQQFTI